MSDADNHDCPYKLVPASQFGTEELAEIYNAGRRDYIVPMLTDTESLRNYVHMYDVDLDASVVILDSEDRPAGIGMLGMRDNRGWITRLGITPERRQGGMGMCMMQALITAARKRNMRLIQLEVIEGNDAAHRLFLRCGFQETRRLMVIRRPVALLPDKPPVADMTVRLLSRDEIWACLAQRNADESWVNENTSLNHIEKLEGLRASLASDYSGWIVFQRKNSEISHVIWQTAAPMQEQLLESLLHHLHGAYPDHNTKIENVPVGEIGWVTLQQFNYFEEFRRIEMFLHL